MCGLGQETSHPGPSQKLQAELHFKSFLCLLPGFSTSYDCLHPVDSQTCVWVESGNIPSWSSIHGQIWMTQSFRPFISVLQCFTASPDHMPSLVSFRVSRQEEGTSNLGHLDQTQNGLHFGHFFNIFLDFSTCLGVLPSLASLYSVWIGKGTFPSGRSQKKHMEISSFLFPPININWAFFSQPHSGFLHQS